MYKSGMKILSLFCFFCLFNAMNSYGQSASVTVNQDREIDKLLELKKEVNRNSNKYRIQIYNGSYSGADNAKSKFYQNFSGWPAEKVFETPNYKIWVGNFETRLEADRALERIKTKFASAFIFKPKKKKN